MDKIVDHVIAAALAKPTDAALDVMRLSLADWLAVGLAGQEEPVARITRELVLAEGGEGVATLFGGRRGPARAVALANGATSHALDLDDTHFAHIGHPSVAVISAALAVAEHKGRSKPEFLRAALAGCEASIRFGLAFGREHYQTGFHQTATAGAFGAAFATAMLCSDDEVLITQALAIVSTRASGLKSQFGTMGKPYNAGIAAANGVEAALLAERGFQAAIDGVDGPLGFIETHHCDGRADTSAGFLMEQVSHKFHACCHGLHATLNALDDIGPLSAKAVKSVEIQTHPRWMSVCNQMSPSTGLEAKFSYRMVTALKLSGYDTARLNTFDDALCHDTDLIALRDKVTVVENVDLPETAAIVRIEAEGQYEARHDIAVQESYSVRAERMRAKVSALLGEARAEILWDAVHDPHAGLSEITARMG